MKTNLLREFCVLAKVGNFLYAADELYMSQSTLSRHIRELEDSLGVALFNRTTRRCELTAYGIYLLSYAEKIVGLEDKCLDGLKDMMEKTRRTIVVGVLSHSNMEVFDMISEFRKACPDVRIDSCSGDSDDLMSMLESGYCDFVFRRECQPYRDLKYIRIPVCSSRLFAFLPEDHPLAGQETVELGQLRGDTFFLGGKQSLSYKSVKKIADQEDLSLNIMHLDRKKDQLGLVNRGNGVTMLFESSDVTSFDNVISLPLEPAVYADINCVYDPERCKEPKHDAFIRFIREFYSGKEEK